MINYWQFGLAVVISPTHRKKGLGRMLMKGCEEIALNLLFETSYLSTYDQQQFYEKLGYTLCEPVNQFGSINVHSKPQVR